MSEQPRPLQYPRVLSIAGSDSGGGAGVQADLKTFAALGCYGMTAITALTAQNTLGVRSIHAVPLDILADQIDAVVEDIGVDAVKIGMLHSAPTVQAVAAALDRHHLHQVVLDPVMVATSGATLIDPPAVASLVRELFPRARLVTPNLDEASLLVERPLRTEADMEAAARQLLAMGARAVLLKGGHLQSDTVSDLLLAAGAEPLWLRQPRIATPNTHGTGCTLSSAIARLPRPRRRPARRRAAGQRVRAGCPACGRRRAHRRRQRPAQPRPRTAGHARAPARMTQGLPPEMQQVVDRLLAFLAQDGCTDEQFDAVAKQLYAFQYAHDEAYRRFCLRRGVAPHRLASWTQIPPVPISAFKDATLSCLPPAECERIFMTSGTTRGDVKGRNHHPTIAVWDVSMRRHFEQRFWQGAPAMPMLLLFPDESELRNSSLARYLSLAARTFGAPGSRSYVSVDRGLDVDGITAALAAAVQQDRPVAILGASASFVHLLDALAASGTTYSLPAGSRILDTGGYKGQSRELAPDAFYDELARAFGVPRERCTNMYGMTELSSQFYDAGNAVVPSVKRAPHWVRTRVVDPLTGRDVPAGERGVLVHCDLANFNSATTILTEDVGVAVDSGFLLLGRAQGAEAKGCSLAVQEFLEAARA